jgi:hypothetical protein
LESFNFYLSSEDADVPLMDAITKRLEGLGRDPKDRQYPTAVGLALQPARASASAE